ncbi:MAG TPA: hypothetical protein DCW29_10465 [Janthinobacterium sp.]|nr:hypothetical protein [Janthinobacterium sp.]
MLRLDMAESGSRDAGAPRLPPGGQALQQALSGMHDFSILLAVKALVNGGGGHLGRMTCAAMSLASGAILKAPWWPEF